MPTSVLTLLKSASQKKNCSTIQRTLTILLTPSILNTLRRKEYTVSSLSKMGNCISELTEPPFQRPTVRLEGCEAGEMSLLSGMNVNLSLRIRNPNKKSLMMDAVAYKLAKQSDGTVLADGTAIKRELFRGESEKVVKVTLKMSYVGMGASAKSMWVKGSTKLDITGTVTFEAAPATGDKEVDCSFRGQWEIELG